MKKEDTQPQHLMYTVSPLHEGPTREYGACATANLWYYSLHQSVTTTNRLIHDNAGCPTRNDALWRSTTSIRHFPHHSPHQQVLPCSTGQLNTVTADPHQAEFIQPFSVVTASEPRLVTAVEDHRTSIGMRTLWRCALGQYAALYTSLQCMLLTTGFALINIITCQ